MEGSAFWGGTWYEVVAALAAVVMLLLLDGTIHAEPSHD